jgi:RNA methyltransferase, TrmH family
MITSAQNEQLKTIRKLQEKKHRERMGLFAAEGEDLVNAAAAVGWEPEILLVAGEDVEPELLAGVSSLGSGTRVVGVYAQRWAPLGGDLAVYLDGVHDPGNVGAVIRSAHALWCLGLTARTRGRPRRCAPAWARCSPARPRAPSSPN